MLHFIEVDSLTGETMIRLATLVWLLASATVLGCNSGSAHSDSHREEPSSGHRFSGAYPIKVVCTTGQVAEMIERIGGDNVAIEALMGPGVDPHLYSPIASDVRKLSAADAIFYNGLHLEGRMAELFVKMARKKAT